MVKIPGYEVGEVVLKEDGFLLRRGVGRDGAAVLLRLPDGRYPEVRLLKRLEHEFHLGPFLGRSWALCPLDLVRVGGEGAALVLTPFPGMPLSHQPLPIGTAEFLPFAVAACSAVAAVHSAGLLHRDLKPGHILFDRERREVRLTGFGLASPRPLHGALAPRGVLEGTLPYMAPEQTGQINRGIDQETDLYSLGVILYQMLTGELPCRGDDPLELIHCIVAVPPVPPVEHSREIPSVLSAIVMKLLAKLPEERYRTAAGLRTDLQRCLEQWQATGAMHSFRLGERDVCTRLVIPQHLYGREGEMAALAESYHEVVATAAPRLVVISGYAGIGKSSLVAELNSTVSAGRSLFATGKFEQYLAGKPYSTIARALTELVQRILMESEEQVAERREEIAAAVGVNGLLLTELVPELELLIGPQPQVPDLPLTEGEHRFHLVLRKFIQLFCRKDRPLVLFLDDLQWADPATLNFLTEMLPHPETRSLLLLVAYRDNEVSPAHPAVLALDGLRRAGVPLLEMVLQPLARKDVGRLVADTLRTDRVRSEPLAALVFEKTGGNPFFLLQFISRLYGDGLITCDPEEAEWSWDLERIHLQQYTDNVVSFLLDKMHTLSEQANRVMHLTACIGIEADLSVVAAVAGSSVAETERALAEAVHEGLLVHADDRCRFVHDRVQQAAYSLRDEASRAATHLAIGRFYLAQRGAAQTESVFDTVDQLNRGRRLIEDAREKAQVASLNLVAGRRAQSSAAYRAALGYLEAGLALLEDCWETEKQLCRDLTFEKAKSAWLAGELAEAGALLDKALRTPSNPLEQTEILLVQSKVAMTKGDPPAAAEAILGALRLNGVEWPQQPTAEEVLREYGEVWDNLHGREIETLVDLPAMAEPRAIGMMEILAELYLPAYWIDLNLQLLVTCRMVNLSLQYGNSDWSPMGYAGFGRVIGPKFERYLDGYRFGKVGYDLVERRKLIGIKARISDLFGISTSFWVVHLRDGLEYARTSFKAAGEVGDLPYACYACMHIVTYRIALGDPLDDVEAEAESLLQFVRAARYDEVADIMVALQLLIATLRGEPGAKAAFDEDSFDRRVRQERSALVANWYYMTKLQRFVLMGMAGSAVDLLASLDPLVPDFMTQLNYTDYVYYVPLALAAHYPEVLPEMQQVYLSRISVHAERLESLARHGPHTFGHRAALVAAELARLRGKSSEAAELYDRALEAARAEGFVQNEAMAGERAARFYLSIGEEATAAGYLRGARYAFLRWGATAKEQQLASEFPLITWEERLPAPLTADQLDLLAIVKASQAISQQIELSKVVATLLKVVMEQSGADRSVLFLIAGGAPAAVAEATIAAGEVTIAHAGGAKVPRQVLNYVQRMKKPILMEDVRVASPFRADPYFAAHRPIAVACLPIVRQKELVGFLYLENHLVAGTFDDKRIALVELLAAQSAISLQNAQLYEAVRRARDDLEDRVEERTAELTRTLEDLRVETEQRVNAVEELRRKDQMLIQQSKQAAMGEMLVNISHHWRQPLNQLSAMVQELGFTYEYGGFSKDLLEEHVEKVVDIVGQLSKTISDFDEFLSPTREVATFDIAAAVRQAVDLVRSGFSDEHIAFEINATENPIVLGNKKEFAQVIVNLLANARDAFIHNKVKERRMALETSREGNTAIVTVSDNAGGISQKIIDKIFDPYFTTKELGKGTGVGLFLCKIIVEKNLQGRLSVRNTGDGAEFRIEVPTTPD